MPPDCISNEEVMSVWPENFVAAGQIEQVSVIPGYVYF